MSGEVSVKEGKMFMDGTRNYMNRPRCLQFSSRAAAWTRRKLHCERGGSLVEMALCTAVLATILFGIIEFSLALYTYNLVAEAARVATRYAAIRGYNSCQYATTTFPNCNLGPDSTGSTTAAATALQNYLVSRNLPFSASMQVTANWWSPTGTWNATTSTATSNQWNLSCNAASDPNATSPLYGDACNFPGHAVQVQVTLAYPVTIPFVPKETINMSSTSEMVISE